MPFKYNLKPFKVHKYFAHSLSLSPSLSLSLLYIYRHDSEFDKCLLLAAGALSPKKNHHLNKDTYVVMKLTISTVFNSRTHFVLFFIQVFQCFAVRFGTTSKQVMVRKLCQSHCFSIGCSRFAVRFGTPSKQAMVRKLYQNHCFSFGFSMFCCPLWDPT